MEYGNLAYKLPEQYDEPIKKRKPQKRKEKTVNTQQSVTRGIMNKCSIREQFFVEYA